MDEKLIQQFTKGNGVISLLMDIKGYLKKIESNYTPKGLQVCGPSIPPVDVLGI